MADDELRRLEREAETPFADDAAARYDQALRRAGKTDELRARFRFKFLCPLRWEALPRGPASPAGETRSCRSCQKLVHFVRSPAELAEHVAQGRCVAFERSRLEEAISGLADHPALHSARWWVGAPCVVSSGAPLERVDLAQVGPRPGAAERLAPGVAWRLGALPLGPAGAGAVRVAFARAPSERVLAEVGGALGAVVEPVLDTSHGLEAALLAAYGPDPASQVLMGDLFGDV